MPEVTESFLRDQLLLRKGRLETAARALNPPPGIVQLLGEVDSALARMEAGAYGLCDVCHDPVETDRLLADPLVRLCLDHLNPEERRALEQDLELASQLQRELLPKKDMQFAGWTVAYCYQPLGLVSGDYCDLVTHEDGSQNLFFAIGDVAGKGVAASLLMSQLRAILRTLSPAAIAPHVLMERAGRVFCEGTMSAFFATLICGRADSSGAIELCNAGHCPALFVQQQKVSRLEATGVPLGMFCNGVYATQKVRLAPGDTLFLYTDGISEARCPTDEEYGDMRLQGFLEQNRHLPSEALIRGCLDDLLAFRSGQPRLDDLTAMAIQRIQ